MKNRNLQLDLLRAVAILMVLCQHTVLFRAPTWDRYFVKSGGAGVDLFFVLSGFLVSGLLFSEYLKHGHVSFRRFVVRRILKIWPPLWFLVLCVFVIRAWQRELRDMWPIITPVVHDLLFVQSYFPGTYGHFWSLSVEEFFYILLPGTFIAILRVAEPSHKDPFRRLPLVILCVLIFCLLARFRVLILYPTFDFYTHAFPAHLRMDGLSFGVLISYFYYFHHERTIKVLRQHNIPLTGTTLALISTCVVFDGSDFWMLSLGLVALYVGFGLGLLLFLQASVPENGALRGIAYIGQHSYSIYLWHIPVLLLLVRLGFQRLPGSKLIYYIACLTAGIAMAKLIEFPVLRLRDRMFPSTDPHPILARESPVSAARV